MPEDTDPQSDKGDDILKRIDPKLLYELLSAQIVRDYLAQTTRKLLLLASSIATAFGVLGLGYLVTQLPAVIAKQAQESIAKVYAEQQEVARVAGVVQAANRSIAEVATKVQNLSQGTQTAGADLDTAKKQILALTADKNKAQQELDKLHAQIASATQTLELLSPDISRAIAQLAQQPKAQLNILSAGFPRGSLLLTAKDCPTGWQEVKARDELLVGAQSRDTAGTHAQASLSVTLRPENIPRVAFVTPGSPISGQLTIPNLKFGDSNVHSSQPFELDRCNLGCGHKLAFDNVQVQVGGLAVSGVVGREHPDDAKLSPKAFYVTVCKLG